MIKATEAEKREILDFLAGDAANCLYLYMDIYWYGLDGDIISVWYEKKDGAFSLIVMKFFSTLQVYSPENDFDPAAFLELFRQENCERVFSRRATVEMLAPYFGDGFYCEFGKVIEIKKYRKFLKEYPKVEQATPADLPEITRLLLMDEENAKSYAYEELLSSLQSLYDTGMGRSYVLREDGKIVAHTSISAESDIFAIGAYTIVHPDYRDTFCGMILDSYMCNVATGEKKLFGFMTDERRIKMFSALGNPPVTEYGKLIKK